MRLAVFASGQGTNLEAIAARLPVSLVFSDRAQARALTILESVPSRTFKPMDFTSREDYEEALAALVEEFAIDIVALAGYMRVVGRPLLQALPGRIVNIHPSLLPAFPGRDAITQAFEAKVAETGVTIHYVDEGIDTGPIIAQEKVPMQDSLAALENAIHSVEHRLYPEVLAQIMEENT